PESKDGRRPVITEIGWTVTPPGSSAQTVHADILCWQSKDAHPRKQGLGRFHHILWKPDRKSLCTTKIVPKAFTEGCVQDFHYDKLSQVSSNSIIIDSEVLHCGNSAPIGSWVSTCTIQVSSESGWKALQAGGRVSEDLLWYVCPIQEAAGSNKRSRSSSTDGASNSSRGTDSGPPPMFAVGSKVQVLWEDCQWYDAEVTKFRRKDKTYTVNWEHEDSSSRALPACELRERPSRAKEELVVARAKEERVVVVAKAELTGRAKEELVRGLVQDGRLLQAAWVVEQKVPPWIYFFPPPRSDQSGSLGDRAYTVTVLRRGDGDAVIVSSIVALTPPRPGCLCSRHCQEGRDLRGPGKKEKDERTMGGSKATASSTKQQTPDGIEAALATEFEVAGGEDAEWKVTIGDAGTDYGVMQYDSTGFASEAVFAETLHLHFDGSGWIHGRHRAASDSYYSHWAEEANLVGEVDVVYHLCASGGGMCCSKCSTSTKQAAVHFSKWQPCPPVGMLGLPWARQVGLQEMREKLNSQRAIHAVVAFESRGSSRGVERRGEVPRRATAEGARLRSRTPPVHDEERRARLDSRERDEGPAGRRGEADLGALGDLDGESLEESDAGADLERRVGGGSGPGGAPQAVKAEADEEEEGRERKAERRGETGRRKRRRRPKVNDELVSMAVRFKGPRGRPGADGGSDRRIAAGSEQMPRRMRRASGDRKFAFDRFTEARATKANWAPADGQAFGCQAEHLKRLGWCFEGRRWNASTGCQGSGVPAPVPDGQIPALGNWRAKLPGDHDAGHGFRHDGERGPRWLRRCSDAKAEAPGGCSGGDELAASPASRAGPWLVGRNRDRGGVGGREQGRDEGPEAARRKRPGSAQIGWRPGVHSSSWRRTPEANPFDPERGHPLDGWGPACAKGSCPALGGRDRAPRGASQKGEGKRSSGGRSRPLSFGDPLAPAVSQSRQLEGQERGPGPEARGGAREAEAETEESFGLKLERPDRKSQKKRQRAEKWREAASREDQEVGAGGESGRSGRGFWEAGCEGEAVGERKRKGKTEGPPEVEEAAAGVSDPLGDFTRAVGAELLCEAAAAQAGVAVWRTVMVEPGSFGKPAQSGMRPGRGLQSNASTDRGSQDRPGGRQRDLLPFPLPIWVHALFAAELDEFQRPLPRMPKRRTRREAGGGYAAEVLGLNYGWGARDWPARGSGRAGQVDCLARVEKAAGRLLAERHEGKTPRSPTADIVERLKGVRVNYTGEVTEGAEPLTLLQVESALPPVGFGGAADVLDHDILDPRRSIRSWPEGEMPRPRVHVESQKEWEDICRLMIERSVFEGIDENDVFRWKGKLVLAGAFGVRKQGPNGTRRLACGKPVLRFIISVTSSNWLFRPIAGDIPFLCGAAGWQSIRLGQDEGACGHGLIYMSCRVLPMGWLSAVGIMEHIGRALVRKAPSAGAGLPEKAEIRRGQLGPGTERLWNFYLDDLTILRRVALLEAERFKDRTDAWQELVRRVYDNRRIPWSPDKSVEGARVCERLGGLIDGDGGYLGPFVKISLGVIGLGLWLVSRRWFSRQGLRIFAGREVHCLNFKRPLFTCYTQLWPRVLFAAGFPPGGGRLRERSGERRGGADLAGLLGEGGVPRKRYPPGHWRSGRGRDFVAKSGHSSASLGVVSGEGLSLGAVRGALEPHQRAGAQSVLSVVEVEVEKQKATRNYFRAPARLTSVPWFGHRRQSSSMVLNQILKRVGALTLAAEFYPLLGYLHTSQNPADAPSRWFEKRKLKWLSHLEGVRRLDRVMKVLKEKKSDTPWNRLQQAAERRKLGKLKENLVSKGTLTRYKNSVAAFITFVKRSPAKKMTSHAKVDLAACAYLAELWENGDGKATGSYTLAGLQFLRPVLKPRMPAAWKLLGAWGKLELPARATPASPLVAFGLAGYFSSRGEFRMVLLIVLCYLIFLRHGEMSLIRRSQWKMRWPLLACTGCARANKRELLADITSARFSVLWNEAIKACGLGDWHFSPYCLRRGGATRYFQQTGFLDRCCHIGRWQDSKTARIYIEDGLAVLCRLSLDNKCEAVLCGFMLPLREWLKAVCLRLRRGDSAAERHVDPSAAALRGKLKKLSFAAVGCALRESRLGPLPTVSSGPAGGELDGSFAR
ncbi:unnamed protein product, partial [Polarella glacialis]